MVDRVGVAGATANALTVNVPWTHYGTSDPIDIAAGDVGILAWNGQSTPTWTPPGGWALAAPEVIGTTGSHRSRVYVRELDGTEDAAPIALTASVTNKMMGMLYVARDVSVADIIDAIASRDETVTGTSHANPQITTVVEDAPTLVIIHERLTDSSTAYVAPSPGYTKRLQVTPIGGGGSVSGAIADDGLAVTRPAETDVTPPPWTGGASTNNVITWTISLTPKSTPSGTGTITATATLTGSGRKITGGTGTITATATASGTGSKRASGTGTITATAALTGSGGQPNPPAFPDAPLVIDVELKVGDTWERITGDVLTDDPMTIERGRADEAAEVAPTKLSMTLRNTGGKYSPRNPRSPYFGLIGRNTPLRLRVNHPDVPSEIYAYMPGRAGHFFSTPDVAGLDITGDLDIRMEITPDAWQSDLTGQLLAAKLGFTGNQQSWAFVRRSTGQLRLLWSPDGTTAARLAANSTDTIPTETGRLAIRVTLDTNNGAAGNTVTFYTAPSIDGPWTALGAPIVQAGTTSVYASTAPLMIGAADDGDAGFSDLHMLHGRLHAFELRSGIDGTVVANPGITDQADGATEWTGPDGLTWAADGAARILKPARFHGEVSKWPPKWSLGGHQITTQIEASGIKRRLGQSKAPVQSVLRRSIPASEGVVAYWPMEDAGGAFASVMAGAPPLRVTLNPTSIGYQDDNEFVGSSPLPRMGTAQLKGTVPAYTVPIRDDGTVWQTLTMLLHVPESPLGGARRLAMVSTTGTASRWDLWYSAALGGKLGFTIYDSDGAKIDERSVDNPDFTTVHGRLLRVEFDIQTFTSVGTGNGIIAGIAIVEQGGGEDSYVDSGGFTAGSWTIGRVHTITIGDPAGLEDTSIGHVTLQNTDASIIFTTDEFDGYPGEPAADRMTRLAAENDVLMTVIGDPATTAAMGPQRTGTLLELLDECAAADGGILGEARDELGLEYRARVTLYNQTPALTLAYGEPGLAAPFEPTDDDQGVVNDSTVTREGGSSARVVVESGPMSVQDPPDGIGAYDEQTTVNVATDGVLSDLASWRVHVAAWDEARYPQLGVKLHKAPEKIPAAVEMDFGDRAIVTGLPPWLPPGPADALIQGYTETLELTRWRIDCNATPGGPWNVAVVDGGDRADTDGSSLVEAVSDAATTLLVASTAGPYWTLDPTDLPMDLDVGGEVVTATAVAELVDGFARTVAGGWGTSPDGIAWDLVGTPSHYSTDGADALLTIPTVNTTDYSMLGLVSPAADVEVAFRSPAAAITGAPVYVYLIFLQPVIFGGYHLRIGLQTNGTVTALLEDRATGALTAERAVPGLTVNGADTYRARLNVQNGLIRARVWKDGTAEPGWRLAAYDDTFTEGQPAVAVHVSTGNTNALPVVARVPELVIHNPQKLAVARAINGIVKSQAAGTDVQLARPSYTAL